MTASDHLPRSASSCCVRQKHRRTLKHRIVAISFSYLNAPVRCFAGSAVQVQSDVSGYKGKTVANQIGLCAVALVCTVIVLKLLKLVAIVNCNWL